MGEAPRHLVTRNAITVSMQLREESVPPGNCVIEAKGHGEMMHAGVVLRRRLARERLPCAAAEGLTLGGGRKCPFTGSMPRP